MTLPVDVSVGDYRMRARVLARLATGGIYLVLDAVNMMTYIEPQIGAGSGILTVQGGTWDDATSQPASRRAEHQGATPPGGSRPEVYVTISRRGPRQDRLVGRAGLGQ